DQLPKRFPKLQQKGLQNPRVFIEDDKLIVAAQFRNRRFDGVFSCELSVQLTEEPNRLAICVHKIRVGALPLPISQLQAKIEKEAGRQGFRICWDENDGETIALVELPSVYPGRVDVPILVESIALRDQQLIVAGQTGDDSLVAYTPQGAIYHIASLAGFDTSEFDMPEFGASEFDASEFDTAITNVHFESTAPRGSDPPETVDP
ncbi:MAG: hypothetical protein AAFV88_09370, partial [Planctomycetota bacterium]